MIKPKILSVILARGGSKAIPNKNIELLNKHPLLAYTIAEARLSKYVSDIYVSSDSEIIRAIALQYGAKAIKRPIELSADDSKPVECILHATRIAEKAISKKYDYVVELLCTNPFKTAKNIDEALEMQIQTNADSVIGVIRLDDHHPIRIKKIIDGVIHDFCIPEIPESRRQDLKPDAYIRNGSIYSMRRDMLEKGIRYGTDDSRAYIMARKNTLNIDEPMDLEIATLLMTKYPRNYVKEVIKKH
jgi:CMP-N-acetylneuraminic acid synthetase